MALTTMSLIEVQKMIPPGSMPCFDPPDRARKEAAGMDPRLGTGYFRKRPDYVPLPVYKAPAPPPAPPPPKILDRCIPAWPDPVAEGIRPYTGNRAGSYNDRRTWGVPYKYSRGVHNPPQDTPVVYNL